MIKSLLNHLFDFYYREWWNIAICDVEEDLTPCNIHWVKPTYNDRWFADPFIIDEDEEYFIVLVEEYYMPEHKGRIARLTISKNDYCILHNETILDLPTHLSFPNYLKVDNQIYIYPENSKSGSLFYYAYEKVLGKGEVLIDKPLTDAVVFRQKDDYYIFSTQKNNCNGNKCEVYKSSSPLSGYNLYQIIEYPDNIARSAGNVFENKGKTIRPAQICNTAYGEGLSFQELTIRSGKVELKEIKRLMPLTKDYPDGFHTYNLFGNKVIIDGYRYRSKFLRYICKCIMSLNNLKMVNK